MIRGGSYLWWDREATPEGLNKEQWEAFQQEQEERLREAETQAEQA